MNEEWTVPTAVPLNWQWWSLGGQFSSLSRWLEPNFHTIWALKVLFLWQASFTHTFIQCFFLILSTFNDHTLKLRWMHLGQDQGSVSFTRMFLNCRLDQTTRLLNSRLISRYLLSHSRPEASRKCTANSSASICAISAACCTSCDSNISPTVCSLAAYLNNHRERRF